MPINMKGTLDRSNPLWPLAFCCRHFLLPRGSIELIADESGTHRLQELWEIHGEDFYCSPFQILRQEWWHTLSPFSQQHQLPQFFDALSPDAHILDYGCGTAEYARKYWYDLDRKAMLVEASLTISNYLAHKYQYYENIDIALLTDIWGDRMYDAIICMDVLEHIHDPIDVTKELCGLLKPGGQALFGFSTSYPHPGHLKESIDQYDDWLRLIRDNFRIVFSGPNYPLWVEKHER